MKSEKRGHFIREWREYNELSQSELARRCALSPSAFSLLESGKTKYTQNVLERVAEVLAVTPATLISSDPFHPNEEREFMIRITELIRDMAPMSRLMALDLLEAVAKFEARQKKEGLARLALTSKASLT
jgi:transcriptional regulator with XRE-family HTH domain